MKTVKQISLELSNRLFMSQQLLSQKSEQTTPGISIILQVTPSFCRSVVLPVLSSAVAEWNLQKVYGAPESVHVKVMKLVTIKL